MNILRDQRLNTNVKQTSYRIEEVIFNLRETLRRAVERNRASSMLFSGGLDTSVLATLNPKILAITISLKTYGEDVKYAKLVAKNLKLKHFHRSVSIDEALEAIPEIIRILKSFDPAIPNDIAIYFGLKTALEWGVREIMTGDGSDELLAGYDFMMDMEELDKYIRRIASSMSFSSNTFGDFFDIKISQPYLDREFVEFVLDIPIRFKIREENGRFWGKWILRKAFQGVLPDDVVWQKKRPLEFGSGMTRLRKIISSRVSDEEFKENPFPIKFMNKEHFYYYKIFREVIGEIPLPADTQKSCLCCGAGMDYGAFHCRICGQVLNWETKD